MSVTMKVLRTREDWLEARKSGIGGSDASAVVGLNPWKSNVELWEEKVGIKDAPDISGNPRVIYGTKAEPLLRQLFILDFPQYKVEYEENNSWSNDRYPWAKASLDGWLTDKDGRKGILEIKTADILSSMSREKWNRGVPDNYFAQALWYMAVTESEFAIIKAQLRREFDGDVRMDTRHYFIEREEVQDQIEWLMDEGRRFWDLVQLRQRPALRLPEI